MSCQLRCRHEKEEYEIGHHFLAHLAHSAKVNFWDNALPVVRRRPTCVVRRESSVVNNFFKEHLLQNYETLQEASYGEGEQTMHIINMVVIATERKKILKNILRKKYGPYSY